jgi:hypothetical protein
MLVNRYVATCRSHTVKKELSFLYGHALRSLRHRLRPRTLLFYPEYPLWETEIFKIAQRLDYSVTNNPRLRFDAVFHWEDTTRRRTNKRLAQLARQFPVINAGCSDISKKRVEAIFTEVFGYSSLVDPTSFCGTAVRKSDLNAQHDGSIVELPVASPEPGCVYQKLLNHVDDEGMAIDYRVPVFGRIIPFMTLRYKPLLSRFTKTARAVLADPQAVFSDGELEKIRLFCSRLGLDYGELDIIRDQADGRVYILDANNTPWSPPPSVLIRPEERRFMLEASVVAFREAFLPLTLNR